MDKNTIIGLLLIFALFIGYSIYISPSKEQLAERQRIQDSIQLAQMESALADSLQNTAQTNNDSVNIIADNIDSARMVIDKKSQFGAFTHAGEADNTQALIVENDKYILQLDPKGAQISSVTLKDVYTYDSRPLTLFQSGNNDNKFGFTFFSNYISVNTYDLYFTYNGSFTDTLKVHGNDSVIIVMRAYPDKDETSIDSTAYIEYCYTIRGNDYRTGLDIRMINTDSYITLSSSQMELIWQEQLLQQEKSLKNEMTANTIYYSDISDVENLKETPDKGDSVSVTTGLKWISFKQLFFTSTIIAKNKFANATMVTEMPQSQDNRQLKNMRARFYMPIDQPMSMDFYFGPNKYRLLKTYDINLESQIQLGGKLFAWINKWIIIPIFNFLEGFGWNYGLIILILTIIIKTVLFPLTYKNYLSSAKMRAVKPEIEEISQRYPKQEDAMKKQQATMALYKQYGISPMAGCLPMLIQFPILIAMFRFFPSSFELRQQPFLWADDLSSYDSIVSWSAHIPIISSFYGNHISLFTLLMTLATLGYTYINNKLMPSSGDAQQMKMMKWMMYLMPIMFLGVFNNYSSGLSYYYLLVNLITFAQMGVFRLCIKEDNLRAKMLVHAQKAKTNHKKSKWQLKMEEMIKQQQAMSAQQRGLPATKQRHNTSYTAPKKK
ncbi:MAG: membrane protein insertase YidC [Bacteroidales bacterium]|nr:membrane protein insertase YidC [Bacteroidales bacterium]